MSDIDVEETLNALDEEDDDFFAAIVGDDDDFDTHDQAIHDQQDADEDFIIPTDILDDDMEDGAGGAAPAADSSSEDEVPLSAMTKTKRGSIRDAQSKTNGKGGKQRATAKSKAAAKRQQPETSGASRIPVGKPETKADARRQPSNGDSRMPPPSVPKEDTLSVEERLVNLLVPHLKVSDVMAMVKKIFETQKSEPEEQAVETNDSRSAPQYICDLCGNTDQAYFMQDYARGDTMCLGRDGNGCGNVVQDHIVFEGNMYRKFEGEEDKSHHGQAPNRLYSSSFNLRTGISNTGKDSSYLRRTAEYVEMNLSQMGKDDRRTRVGYKDQMKRKAFEKINNAAHNLDLHDQVITRAQLMFAEFRDVREHVHQFDAMVAACMIAAYLASGKAMHDGSMGETREKLSYKDFLAVQATAGKQAVKTGLDEGTLAPYVCTKCGLRFNAKKWLQYHPCKATAAGTGVKAEEKRLLPKPMGPPTASAALMQPKTVSLNLADSSTKKAWFQCDQCTMKFATAEKLEQHSQRHKRKKIVDQDIDLHALPKKSKLASANPSVQVPHTRERVKFRGEGLRPWMKTL